MDAGNHCAKNKEAFRYRVEASNYLEKFYSEKNKSGAKTCLLFFSENMVKYISKNWSTN